MKLKGEELRKNRRKRLNLWLSDPNYSNEEQHKDQKEHPEKWVDYYIRMASEWRNECKALDAELDEKETELKNKENELIEKETELKNKELSLSADRLDRVEEERLHKAIKHYENGSKTFFAATSEYASATERLHRAIKHYENSSKMLFAATCIYVVLIAAQLIKMFSQCIG